MNNFVMIFYFVLAVSISIKSFGEPPDNISFEKESISVGDKKITVEVASTPSQMARGLMFRKSLPDGNGMLFVYDRERPLSFWMKNTLVPLSIGFFNSKGVLEEILDMEPASPMDKSPKSYPSQAPAQYALEVPKGWFKKVGIKSGDKLIREPPKK